MSLRNGYTVTDKRTNETYFHFPGIKTSKACPHLLDPNEAQQLVQNVCSMFPDTVAECLSFRTSQALKPPAPIGIENEKGVIVGIISPVDGNVKVLPVPIPPPPPGINRPPMLKGSRPDMTGLLADLQRGIQLKKAGPVAIQEASVPEVNAFLEELKDAAKNPNLRKVRDVCDVGYIWSQKMKKCIAVTSTTGEQKREQIDEFRNALEKRLNAMNRVMSDRADEIEDEGEF